MKKRMDFLPNKLNKYSIRRFTVGTASILVGATLVFGIGNNEAHASEKTSTEESTQSNEDTASQDSVKQKGDVQTNEQATNNNVNPEQVDVTNEATTSEESTTEETPKAETTKEAPTTAEEPKKEAPATAEAEEPKVDTTKEAPATAETPKADTTKEEPATTEEAPKADTTTEEPATTEEAPKADTTKETPTTTDQTPESNQTDSQETTTEQSTQPTTQTQNSPEANTTQEFDTVVNNVQNASTTEDKQEALTNYIADTNNTSKEDAKAQVENLDLDYKNLDETTLLSVLAQDYSNKKDSTTTYATPRSTTSTPKPVNRLGIKKLAAVRQGTNVNDKVHFSNIDIAIDKGHTNPQTGQKEFWATSSDVLKLKSDYTIDDDVHEGDQMTFQYGKYFRPGSVSLPSTQQNLYDANGGLVAKGIYDSNTNSTTYTFTNYVDQYNNIKGSFEQITFAKRENATTDKTAYPMQVTLGNQSYSKDVIVDYGNKENAPIITSTNYIENGTLARHMTAYINQPKSTFTKEIFTTNLTGFKFDPTKNNFKIYEVTDQNQFVDSFTPDTSNLKDVTSNFKINYSNNNQTATVDLLNGTRSSNKQYIIEQVAYPLDTANDTNGKIDYRLDTNEKIYTWSNSYSVTAGSSTANGDLKKYALGDYVWEDTNKDGKQDADEKGIQGVYVILKDANGKELDRTTTDATGKYQFNNLTNGTYTVEFSTPEGYTPTTANAGTDDSVDSDG